MSLPGQASGVAAAVTPPPTTTSDVAAAVAAASNAVADVADVPAVPNPRRAPQKVHLIVKDPSAIAPDLPPSTPAPPMHIPAPNLPIITQMHLTPTLLSVLAAHAASTMRALTYSLLSR